MAHPFELVRQEVDNKFTSENWDPSLFILHFNNPEEGPTIKRKILDILNAGVSMSAAGGEFNVRLQPYEITEGAHIFMIPYGYSDMFRQHAVEWACRRVQRDYRFDWLYCKTGTDSIAVARTLGLARPSTEP